MNDIVAAPTEALTCSICGCSSTLRASFAQGRDGSKARTRCPVCEEKHTRKVTYLTLAFVIVGIVLGASHVNQHPNEFARALPYGFAVFYVSIFTTVLPHELAHALVAKLVGLPPVAIVIGRGRMWFDRTVFGLRLQFGTVPRGGFTLVDLRPCSGFDARMIALVAAGPLTNLALGIGAIAVARYLPEESMSAAWRMAALGFGAANLLIAVGSIVPGKANSANGSIDNDGALIAKRLRGEPVDFRANRAGIGYLRASFAYSDRDYEAAGRLALEAEALAHDLNKKATLTVLRAESLSESDEPALAIELLTPLLVREDCTPELRTHIDQAWAWAVLLADDSALLPDALARMTRAVELMPWAAVAVIKHSCVVAATPGEKGRLSGVFHRLDLLDESLLGREARAYLAFARVLVAHASGDSGQAHAAAKRARNLGITAAPARLLHRLLASP